jgi:hypothetical protein
LDTKELILNGYFETIHPQRKDSLMTKLDCMVSARKISRGVALALINRNDFRVAGPFGYINKSKFLETDKEKTKTVRVTEDKKKINYSKIVEKAFEQTLLIFETCKEKKDCEKVVDEIVELKNILLGDLE